MILRFILTTIANFLFITGLGILTFTYAPIIYSEAIYASTSKSNNQAHNNVQLNTPNNPNIPDIDDSFDYANITPVVAVDPNFSVIIDKINVNAPVVADVSTVNNLEYMNALSHGVAHAKGTPYPGQDGNMFLFAHSSINFWQLGPYATVFNLLNKVEVGDNITMVYKGRPYVYRVFSTEVVPGWNTKPFDDNYTVPVITLVTCDPPGSTQNRLVVKAKLI